uniref:hypothetical protein n=1 Tax=Candidatus Electronema sp. TaxID=2698783 RepID=UPI0040577942
MAAPILVCTGKTEPKDWDTLSNGRGIYVEVDLRNEGFGDIDINPISVVTSLGGENNHWATTGASSVYNLTEKGFTVYVRWIDGGPLNREFAKQKGWHINWIAMQY